MSPNTFRVLVENYRSRANLGKVKQYSEPFVAILTDGTKISYSQDTVRWEVTTPTGFHRWVLSLRELLP